VVPEVGRKKNEIRNLKKKTKIIHWWEDPTTGPRGPRGGKALPPVPVVPEVGKQKYEIRNLK
jgi:hypothetical protein